MIISVWACSNPIVIRWKNIHLFVVSIDPRTSLYVSLGTEAALHTLGVVTVRLRLVPDIPTRLRAGRGAGGVAESVLTHDGCGLRKKQEQRQLESLIGYVHAC